MGNEILLLLSHTLSYLDYKKVYSTIIESNIVKFYLVILSIRLYVQYFSLLKIHWLRYTRQTFLRHFSLL